MKIKKKDRGGLSTYWTMDGHFKAVASRRERRTLRLKGRKPKSSNQNLLPKPTTGHHRNEKLRKRAFRGISQKNLEIYWASNTGSTETGGETVDCLKGREEGRQACVSNKGFNESAKRSQDSKKFRNERS